MPIKQAITRTRLNLVRKRICNYPIRRYLIVPMCIRVCRISLARIPPAPGIRSLSGAVMPLLRILCLAFSTLILGVSAYAQSDAPRVVAVLISADADNSRIERLATALQGVNAETKIVAAPSDSEMRALLQSFANIALESDVVIIYIDAPILKLGERGFVATRGLTLPRASALLTRAVPLSAFARAAALAGNGGLVMVGAQDFGGTVPSGATQASAAPGPRNGLAPIVFMPQGAADSAIAALAIALEKPTVELGDMMATLTSINDVTQSQTLPRPVVLRAPPVVSPTQTPAPPAAGQRRRTGCPANRARRCNAARRVARRAASVRKQPVAQRQARNPARFARAWLLSRADRRAVRPPDQKRHRGLSGIYRRRADRASDRRPICRVSLDVLLGTWRAGVYHRAFRAFY